MADYTDIKIRRKYPTGIMNCPYCGFLGSRVIHSRPSQKQAIVRYWKCGLCGSRFVTQGSSREPFNERLRLVLIKKIDGYKSKKS